MAHSLQLHAPLNTVYRIPQRLRTETTGLNVLLRVPDDAPADLGVAAWVADDEGMWFKQDHPQPLRPGLHNLFFDLQNNQWSSEPSPHEWNHYKRQLCQQWGLSFWSATDSRSTIEILNWKQESQTTASMTASITAIDYALTDITCQELWQCQFRLSRMPENPYRYHQGRAWMHCVPLDNKEQQTEIHEAFYKQSVKLIDRGQNEEAQMHGRSHFCVRFRPRYPGRYRMILHTHFPRLHSQKTVELGVLTVTDAADDPYIRVDEDQRYLSRGNGDFVFPVGLNINCVHDKRGARRTHSSQTPQRGWHAYRSYLDRLARAQGDCTEIWLSSWNLGFEWHDRWPGYHGLKGFNEANAERFERIVAHCEERGISIIAVVNNHGQAARIADHEWQHNPLNRQNGGPLHQPEDVFMSETARPFYSDYHRYLQARYGHSPAILMWKLFSETDLTQVGYLWRRKREQRYIDALTDWHQQMALAWKQRDPYGHLITTHWSTNYKWVEAQMARLDALDCLPVNAYHSERLRPDFLGDMVSATLADGNRGLAGFHKPVVITEFGGDWRAAPPAQLDAEIRSGPWYGIVCGLANAPMTWWFEWVDQNNAWHAMTAVQRFMQGEDLRQYNAGSHFLTLSDEQVWAKGLLGEDKALIYFIDRRWGRHGGRSGIFQNVYFKCPQQLQPGTYQIQFHDANSGIVIDTRQLELSADSNILLPDFRYHLACKLKHLR